MKESTKTKTIMIASLVIGIIGYSYIMIFKKPGVLEVLTLIFFALIIHVSSGYCFDKNYHGFKFLDYINKQYNNEFLKVLDLTYPIIVTLLIFFGMNR